MMHCLIIHLKPLLLHVCTLQNIDKNAQNKNSVLLFIYSK